MAASSAATAKAETNSGVDPKMIGNKQNLLFDADCVRTVDILLAAGVDECRR
ncbi:MAG TPA: hypothetical protein VF614_11965 [Chthoniobacteraceae bacterium]